MGGVSKKGLNKCCVCPCKRAFCKWPFIILAILTLVFTIFTLYMCLKLQESRFYNLPGYLYDFSVMMVIWIFMISIVSLIAIVMGIAAGCLKSRCLVVTFGILFLPVWIIYMLAATSFYNFIERAKTNKDGFKVFCDPEAEKDGPFGKNMKAYADDLQILYEKSDKWMCSSQCPCKPKD